MKNIRNLFLAFAVMMWVVPIASAGEHGGKEHGGTAAQEQGGTTAPTPSADDIRATMKNYVDEQSKATGTFDINDPETSTARKLQLERVHERVGKTGNYYYSCADFKDTETGETLDLDLDVADNNGSLSVADVRIHKLEGKERYTYDENDNRIPVEVEAGHAGHEHGGKEHGGK